MHRLVYSLIALVAVGAVAAAQAKPLPASEASPDFSGHQFAHLAHISLSQARTIALEARPGAITDEELEREKGGSGLRYSFDVKSSGVTWEVGVDAKTGVVLENDREGRHPD
jgi:uncharacterized membrane protein YkoI